MAAGIMDKPGEIYCSEVCQHRDCRAARYQWQLPCLKCHQLIQPGERYYIEATDGERVTQQVHARCEE